MKKLRNYVIVFVVLAALAYALVSIGSGQFDTTKWGDGSRGTFGAACFFIALVTAIIVVPNPGNDIDF